jgi:type VI protein secretion system component Hcp
MSPVTRWIVVTLALVLALAALARPAAALDIYLRLFLEAGGEIQGETIFTAEANAIEVLSVAVSSVQTPVDVSTLRATGNTQWTGLVLTKRFDRSSPAILIHEKSTGGG